MIMIMILLMFIFSFISATDETLKNLKYEIKDDIQRICELNGLLSEEIELPDGNGTENYVFEKIFKVSVILKNLK